MKDLVPFSLVGGCGCSSFWGFRWRDGTDNPRLISIERVEPRSVVDILQNQRLAELYDRETLPPPTDAPLPPIRRAPAR